jgi:hypothetical protein
MIGYTKVIHLAEKSASRRSEAGKAQVPYDPAQRGCGQPHRAKLLCQPEHPCGRVK